MLEAPPAAEKADTLFSMINTSTVDHLQCRKNLLKGSRVNTPQRLSKQFNNTLNLIQKTCLLKKKQEEGKERETGKSAQHVLSDESFSGSPLLCLSH